MDFLDPKKKRAYNIRLFIGFVLVGVVLILATIILALITAGYSYDRKTGTIIQNGLVFLNSTPVSANISINGKPSGTTNARLELPSGNYTFKLTARNYHPWSNTVSLLGSTVQQISYPFLFPTAPVESSPLNFASEPQIVTVSPSRQWILASVPGQVGTFSVVTATNLTVAVTTASIPASVLPSEPGANVLSVVQWSTDNQHVLLKDTYQGGYNYIMFDWANPSISFNVNQTFSTTTFTNIKLVNDSFDSLYLYNQATQQLLLADVTTKTVTPLLSDVISYWPYGTSQVLYVTPDISSTTEVDAKLYDSGSVYTLKDLPIGSAYLLNMASYNGNLYIVIGSNSSPYDYVYQNVANELKGQPSTELPLPYTLLVIDGVPEAATFSTSARFIAIQSSTQIAIYDLEAQTHYRYNFSLPLSSGQLVAWMDGNRLDVVSGSRLYIWDFDGTNMVNFTAANSDFTPDFNQNYSAVYTTTPLPNSTTGVWELLRTSLVAGKQ